MTKEVQTKVDALDEARGKELVELLGLTPIPGSSPAHFQTSWGTKTHIGLTRTVERIVNKTAVYYNL